MPVEIGPEWREHIEELRGFRGRLMLLGAPDTGKTSFAVALANMWLETGVRVVMMDLDLGQSELGPPGTMGLAAIDKPLASLSNMPHAAIEFVGTTSPARHQAAALAAAVSLASRAPEHDVFLIDSCGYVHGPAAREYKLELLRLLRPSAVAGLQTAREIEPLMRLTESLGGVDVRRVPASSFAVRRTPEMRQRRREVKWARYFRESEVHTVSLEQTTIAGSWWRSGEPLDQTEMGILASILGGSAHAAERAPGALTIIQSGQAPADTVMRLQERFRVEHVYVLHPSRFRNVLCGICDAQWRTIGIGILRNIDFAREELSILSPVRSAQSISALRLGRHRVRPDGKDLGPLQLWEV